MSNILNHNREQFKIKINRDRYWDYHLSTDKVLYFPDGLTERCLSAYIDFNDPDCVWFDEIKSKEQYIWKFAKTSKVALNHIGTTGVDNGFYHYDKNKITNALFYEIFLNSILELDENDKRLKLNKVYGNNKLYDYPINLVEEDNMIVAKANGGFYQGFYKLEGYDYQVLPTHIDNGIDFEITLKKCDFIRDNDKKILNDTYPENKGIFFYMGLRAENKWWKYYDVETNFKTKIEWYFDSEYIKDEFYNNANYEQNLYYIEDDDSKNLIKEKEPYFNVEGYFNSEDFCQCDESYVKAGYLYNGYVTYDGGSCCMMYDKDGYVEPEAFLDEDSFIIRTSDGFSFNKTYREYIDYHTDNKFLFFDRTKDGFTTSTWDESYDITVSVPKIPEIGNYFLLFNRTKNGYTTKTINEVIEKERQKYNVISDLYRNAFAMQITDDGKVGYRFAIKDCEAEEENIKVLSDFSEKGVIKDNIWQVIHVKIIPIKSKRRNIQYPLCTIPTTVDDTMKIFVYVDGKLVFVSSEMPMFNFKALKEHKEKQQGVPFNISIGGGTQGLCDVVYLNYRKYPEYILPLEENFGGSFIGYIKDFKFYTCPLDFIEIRNNFNFAKNTLNKK